MEIQAIGVLTFVLGLAGLFAGQAFATYVFIGSTLLASSAAIGLSSLGGASIQPAYVLLGFLTGMIAANRSNLLNMGKNLTFPQEGFWLLLTVTYAAIAAVFFPRLFAGTTYVFSSARSGGITGIVETPLAPTSNNITQTVYIIGDLVCFLLFVTYASNPKGLLTIVRAFIAAAVLNLVFAAIDWASYRAGLANTLAFLRNAEYRMLDDVTSVGFKRIVGSFPEASVFAYFTVGFFAFCTRLWLDGIWAWLTGPVAFASLFVLAFATSSTGYVATAGFLIVLSLVNGYRVTTGAVRKSMMAFVFVVPLLIATGLVGLYLYQPGWAVLEQIVDQSILNKMSSSSGMERAQWNEQALINFTDTYGVGAGVGSVRASSFLIAVLGNVGVPGALLYGAFLIGVGLRRSNRWPAPFPAACQSAARWACFAQLCGAAVSGGFIDLGLPFYVLAGLACANPQSRTAPGASHGVNSRGLTRGDMTHEGV